MVFFDRSMLSVAPPGATAACVVAELVWVAADPDRACEARRRGVRWRLRAGLFASPVSAFAALFGGSLLAIAFVLWIRIALRDAYTTTSPALGAGRGGDQEEAVDVDSNASFAGEVERNVSPDNDFSLRGKLHQVRSDPGRLLASLRGRRTCISASSMRDAGGRGQTENLSLTKRLQYRLCCASGW